MSDIVRAVITAYHVATHTADVRPIMGPAAVLEGLPVLESCRPDLLAADDNVAVLLWSDVGGVVLGPWGAADRVSTFGLLLPKGPATLEIAAGAITIGPHSRYQLDTAGGAVDLDTINGGTDGQVVMFHSTSGSRDVIFKHNTGNIFLQDGLDFRLLDSSHLIVLVFRATWWRLVCKA